MSAQSDLDITGNFQDHPLAELLVETSDARLSGSIRLTRDQEKSVIYLDRGMVVFAASNQRRHRLFDLLLKAKKITTEQLVGIEDFVNDLTLSENLRTREILSNIEIESFFLKQISEIISAALYWDSGIWNFSPLIRVKDSVRYRVELHKSLISFSRELQPENTVARFKSEKESFAPKPVTPVDLVLESHEGFILSRFEKSFLSLGELEMISGLPAATTRQALYSLWLGGFLFRKNWDSALSERTLARIQSAQLRLKTDEAADIGEAELPTVALPPEPEKEVVGEEAEPEESAKIVSEPVPDVDPEERLQRYLERVESASNLYEVIGASPAETTSSIKQKYFAQAKKYHPDLFYKQPEIHARIQDAFTELAHAYETLKEEKTRELYDFKIRKELARIEARRASGAAPADEYQDRMAEQAEENFNAGQELLMAGESEESIPYFARAVHLANSEASYHAFYGKALLNSPKHVRKAETELQTAVRLEPENTTYRLMLAELFVHIGLMKRAEGELNRLLAIAPNDREAIALLDSLRKK